MCMCATSRTKANTTEGIREFEREKGARNDSAKGKLDEYKYIYIYFLALSSISSNGCVDLGTVQR